VARVRHGPALTVVARGTGGGVRDPARRPRPRATSTLQDGARRRVLPAGDRAPRRAVGGNRPRTGARFSDPHHPYAGDLDLFGEGSLYELLCEARTSMGEATLAAWLLGPSEPEAVRARQAAVQALTPRLDLREDLAILGEQVAATVRPDGLTDMGGLAAGPPSPPDARSAAAQPWRSSRYSDSLLGPANALARGARLRLAAAGVFAVALAVVAGWAAGWAPPMLAVVALVVQGLVDWRLRAIVRAADSAVAGHGPDLDLLAALLERLEREPAGSPLLDRLRTDLVTEGWRPWQAVRRLRVWVDLLDSRRNQFFAPFALASMWGVHCALAIEAWRARHGASVGAWLAAVGQLEALCSLAGYAYEHPADPYPTLEEGEARFEAEALGHPLIPEDRCVRNDVALGGATSVLMVSGSNMSGKSTLLRAVGTNAVLAQAGAPVRASRLRLSPLTLGATLRIRDSLQEGTSRFYAELVRLRDIVRIAGGSICCSCSTRFSTGPTRTTAAWAPRPWCAAWCSAAPSVSSPPTTWRCRRWWTIPPSGRSTCTSKIGSTTGRWCSTTACAPAWSARRTRWR
jgi:hypothetical protein